MVEGLFSLAHFEGDSAQDNFGDIDLLDAMTGQDLEGSQHMPHASTLAAGKCGFVVLLPMATQIYFMSQHPGLLLSLLAANMIVMCSYFKPKENAKTYNI